MATTMTARTARIDEAEEVTRLCLAAFADEAVTAWVIPDPAARREHLRHMVRASLEGAIEAGSLVLAIASDGAPVAASFWMPRAARSGLPAPSNSVVADDDPAGRFAAVEAATHARRPDTEHLYLSSMATLPSHRGQGAGGAMLTEGIGRARAAGLPVYLEASTSDNRRLYERTGFRALGGPLRLPDGGPTLQPMWRRA